MVGIEPSVNGFLTHASSRVTRTVFGPGRFHGMFVRDLTIT